ncbi:Disease resistance protein [Cinnamomum micranthum f. kanehirae]|uniref:Disease resistance protein n=1 Tax=Cinnamomum micranthum f. kanehirae TaxID=337451 RepID=A0A3S3N2L0_9MAGN|nr:Disease resistance protein [Cinnamomum micranthum f. kanehirae]
MGILALSYWDLPAHLKPCFLYLGVFPEDYEIDSEKLIRLWIAEGFIQQRDDETMEDVAGDYLEELFDRSMVQVSRKRSDGPVVNCRIHDLLRDLSISKATQNNFFTIHNVEGACSFSSTNVRRLALHRSINGYHPTVTLRSLLNFRDSGISYSEFRQAKLLRVMRDDFMFPREPTSIKELKEFVHLRYLELNGGEGLLPSSIGDLNNLQTLVLDLSIGSLPEPISNLEQLRHLEALENTVGNLQVNKLTNLQTLCLQNGNWIKDGFGNLTNLRKLIITGDGSLNETLPDSIGKLLNLRSLALYGTVFLPQLKPFTHHSHLYEMSLFGAMKELPELPPNLVELTLGSTNLEEAAISKLEKLSHLKILKLFMDSYKVRTMIFSSGSFPQLETLIMADIPLKEWIIEEGAMPSLKSVLLNTMQFLNTQTLPKRVRALLKHI